MEGVTSFFPHKHCRILKYSCSQFLRFMMKGKIYLLFSESTTVKNGQKVVKSIISFERAYIQILRLHRLIFLNLILLTDSHKYRGSEISRYFLQMMLKDSI